ncbi:MAG: iron-sulfur cluster assembly accessory protein [Holosporales bacterium]|nr:iron-sulfur cluster assembly accessory protein [Holosporales bacterium]
MITITKKAAEKIKKLIEEQNAVGVDILIESSGCSGLNYSLSYEKNADTTDKAKIEVDGISFFYDKEMELMIRGIDIDIVENGISNGFSVTNKYHRPCQNCTCGCR